jgi:hypothetical protein
VVGWWPMWPTVVGLSEGLSPSNTGRHSELTIEILRTPRSPISRGRGVVGTQVAGMRANSISFRGGGSGEHALTECAQVEHTRATTLVVYLAGKAFAVTFVGVVVLTL